MADRRYFKFSLAGLIGLVISCAVAAALYGYYMRLGDPDRAFWSRLNEALSHQPVRRLDLEGIPIPNTGLERLSELPNLEILLLGRTSISDDDLQQVTQIKSLRAVVLPGGVSDDGLAQLQELPRLEILDLQECVNLTAKGLRDIESFKQLKVLQLSGTAPQQSVDRLKEALPHCSVRRYGDPP